jgi:hypothetical protein
MYTHCPAQSRWKQENLNSLRVQELINLPEYQQILKEVSEVIGKPITFLDLGTLSDTLEFLKHSGKEVPPFFVDEKSELLRGLKAIYNLYIQVLYYYSDEQIRTTTSEFFNHTITNFRKIIADPNEVQWIFYSTHDITVGTILRAMNMTSIECVH